MGLSYKRLGGSTGSGSTPGSSVPYTQTFLAISWSLNVSVYEFTVLQANHEKGVNTQVQVFEKIGSNYKEVMVDIEVNAVGDIKLVIDSSTDLRFEGKVVIL